MSSFNIIETELLDFLLRQPASVRAAFHGDGAGEALLKLSSLTSTSFLLTTNLTPLAAGRRRCRHLPRRPTPSQPPARR